MAKPNGKVPGTYVSKEELNDLGEFLSTLRDYIVSHEARIELIEGWIGEFMQAQNPQQEKEADGPSETEASEDSESVASAENEGLALESADDSA